ncbi:hypothetical protein M3Y99_01702400 [Aphelenchoides fujianensis]|nr:hypothetical protein M3Y99_01702400 [Aphelenchoides fujianensis]
MEDPDMSASARSLGESSGEQGAEWMQSDRRSLRRKLEEAQSELYELKRALPFLNAVDPENPQQSLVTSARGLQKSLDLKAEIEELREEIAVRRANPTDTLDVKVQKLVNCVNKMNAVIDGMPARIAAFERNTAQLEARIREAAKRSGYKMPFPPK